MQGCITAAGLYDFGFIAAAATTSKTRPCLTSLHPNMGNTCTVKGQDERPSKIRASLPSAPG